jgi:hypothetical protein
VTAATEPIVSSLFVGAPVVVDSGNKILFVKRPETESGYTLLLWRECHGEASRLLCRFHTGCTWGLRAA